MNNEEKILELLARHEDSFEKINQTLARHEDSFEKINQTLAEMRADMADLKATQAEQGKLLEEIDQRSIRTQVLLETEVRDNIKLLFDGQAHIQETLKELKPAPRLEVLESDVSVLKAAVKANSSRIAELEKAQ